MSVRARVTNEELNNRLKRVRSLAALASKRSELVKIVENEFNCSSVHARSYVRKAGIDQDFFETMSEKSLLLEANEMATRIEYYLWKMRPYVKSIGDLKILMCQKFSLSNENAEIILSKFQENNDLFGETSSLKHAEKRELCYKVLKAKINSKEWPPAKIFLCTDCESRAIHYHHPNYSYPLWVEPVCQKCHLRIHTILQQRMLD